MERRKFLVGMGSLAAGGAAAMGTGAFTSTQATRAVSVDVTGDGNSYLGLSPYGDGSVVKDSSTGVLSIDLASDSGQGGTGISNNALTQIWPAFKFQNQGNESLYIEIDNPFADSNLNDGGVDVQFLAVDNADGNLTGDNTAVLFDRTSVVQSVSGVDRIRDPASIQQSEGSSIARGYKGSSKGGQRFKGPGDATPAYLGLEPGKDVDVIVRAFARVDDPSTVDLSDNIAIEAYTDEANTTLSVGENWLGD